MVLGDLLGYFRSSRDVRCPLIGVSSDFIGTESHQECQTRQSENPSGTHDSSSSSPLHRYNTSTTKHLLLRNSSRSSTTSAAIDDDDDDEITFTFTGIHRYPPPPPPPPPPTTATDNARAEHRRQNGRNASTLVFLARRSRDTRENTGEIRERWGKEDGRSVEWKKMKKGNPVSMDEGGRRLLGNGSER
ncbi:hypothetical protein KPH14_008863 [Odynerus spinipes]|uniref:Uncharacterized protein n=1 Tax=Odynerus spinipes TaxID=1348599 RepID=A0AAD9VHT1_9HYME|nr:hypothetical protein KPH14_008863 [Odynerus spinipes]